MSFPLSLTNILHVNCEAQQGLDTSLTSATIISCIAWCTLTQVSWFIKNNSSTSSAKTNAQNVLIIGS